MPIEIFEFAPARATQFAGPNSGQREQTKCKPRDGPGIILLCVIDHLLQPGEIGDRRLTPFPEWLERCAQLLRRIGLRHTSRNGIKEYRRDALPNALCRFDRAPVLNLLERSEEHTSELQSLMRISYAVF